MHAKTRLVPATCNDSICVQVHAPAFRARHRPLLAHSRAKVLLTTPWTIQIFPPCHCLVFPKPGLSAQGVQRGGIVPLTFGPCAGCKEAPRGAGTLRAGVGCWRAAGDGCCTLLSTGRLSEVTVFEGGAYPEASLCPIALATAFPR